MRSTFMGLETAKRSLFTQQAAMTTTGHNIANANTQGYSRQTVNMAASKPLEAMGLMRSNTPGQIGTGVEFSSITRVREAFLDQQYRNENTSYGSWDTQFQTLSKVEKIFNEPSDTGLRSVIDNFWKSWADLAQHPEDNDGRKIVRENAIALTDAFNLAGKQLSDLSADLTSNIDVKANEMNTITATIANLNDQIKRVEGFGDNANDLRDQRDLLTDQLSKIANIKVRDTADGYQIMMGGVQLVNGKTPAKVDSASLASALAAGDLNAGEVHGMFIARDQFVSDYQKQLDTLANSIANGKITVTFPAGTVFPQGSTVGGVTYSGTVAARTLSSPQTVTLNGLNELHSLAYPANGPAGPGIPFFVAKGGGSTITAASFSLNSAINNNASLIATSMRTEMNGSTETVVKGNNTGALLISQLKDTQIQYSAGAVIGQGTVDDFFRSMIGQLGVQAQSADRYSTNSKDIVDQIDSRRQSVSGVSLDEEMSNLIKFQHAYNAAARMMTTMDQIYDRIINNMGLVGR